MHWEIATGEKSGGPTDASNQGAISDNNFFQKRYHWVTDQKKGVTECEIAQNPGNFNKYLFFIICCDPQNFSKFDDFAGKFWSKEQQKKKKKKKKKIGGSFGVKWWKRGAFGDKPIQKRGSIDRRMMYTG